MSFLLAKSVKPPAIASAWRIDMRPFVSGTAPGLFTSPMT